MNTKLATVAVLTAALIAAPLTPAHAEGWHHGGGWGGHGGGWGGGYHGGGWGGGYRGGGYHRGWGGPGLIGGLALGVGAVVGGAVALATAPVRIVAEAAAPPPAYYPPAPAYYGYGQGYYARPAAYSYPAYTTYAYPEYPQQ